jgi:hypothetical protein
VDALKSLVTLLHDYPLWVKWLASAWVALSAVLTIVLVAARPSSNQAAAQPVASASSSAQVVASGRDLHVHGDVVFSQPQGSSTAPFFVRNHAALLFGFPGRLLYRYTSAVGDRLAPVGIAAVIEATNKRASAAKVYSYTVDALVDDRWVRLPNLQALNLNEFFWVNDGDLSNSNRVDFSANSFDAAARMTTLAAGESVKGWIFLEWPRELRVTTPIKPRLRISIENNHGEKHTTVLDNSPPVDDGPVIAGGEWHLIPQRIDLRALPLLPHVDLLNGFRDGTGATPAAHE